MTNFGYGSDEYFLTLHKLLKREKYKEGNGNGKL